MRITGYAIEPARRPARPRAAPYPRPVRRLLPVLACFLLACPGPSVPNDSEPPFFDSSVRDAPADAPRPDGGVPTGPLRCPDVPTDPRATAERPRARVDVSLPPTPGTVRRVEAGGDLQAALDVAVGGDVIELARGATFTGTYYLRDHGGSGWVTIRSDGAIPAEGERAAPSDAPEMARILAPASLRAIETDAGAHHYRLIGLEITTDGDVYTTALVDLGSNATTVAELPHHIVFDRSYFHGSATLGTRRGIAMNSGEAAVIDSTFTDFREMGADSQAIAGWTGPGPFGIYGNYLAGAAENVMFGGAPSRGPAFNPADIEICGNHFDKPLTWYELDPSYAGLDWVNKNLFELKNARRVLFAGNVLTHSWGDGQVGYAILLTPRAEGDTSLEHAVEDVTIAFNVMRNVGAGVSMSSRDDGTPGSLVERRIWITQNVIEVDGPRWNGAGRGFQIVWGGATAESIVLTHNTVRVTGNAAMALGDDAPITTGLVMEDNVLEHGDYGVFGSGFGEGTAALDHYVPGYAFRGNVMFGGGTAASYPSGNLFLTTLAEVGFTDAAAGDYALTPASPARTAAVDGGAAGADVDAVRTATTGVAP